MKKKIWIKLSSLLLAALCAFSAAACTNDADDDTVENGSETTATYQGPGVHEDHTTETDKYILQNGASDYKIVLPADAYVYEEKGAALIANYLAQATGYTFPVVTDDEIDASYKQVISVGDTEFMRNSGIPVEFDLLDHEGYKIVTQGESVFISGARSTTRAGTYYGAQDFLERVIGWRAYTTDCVDYKKTPVVKLYDFDVTEVPDFKFRDLKFGNLTYDETWIDYARLSNRTEAWLPLDGHSHMSLVPPETYYEAHPDWYTREYDGTRSIYYYGQICLSKEELIEEFSQNLATMFKQNPAASYAHLGIMDNYNYCSCDGCKAVIAENNTNYTGLMIIFTNQVARRTAELVHATEPDRELYFQVFAYKHTLTAPADFDANGNLVLHSENVVPDDNIYVQFTPLDYNASETIDDELNKKTKEQLDLWCAFSKNVTVYQYASNFRNYSVNHANWNSVVTNLRYYADHGVDVIEDQGGGGQSTNLVQLIELRIYVESQIMWDLSLSWETLVEDFIAHFYGPVAEEVQEMYDLMTSYNAYAKEQLGMTGSVYLLLDEEKYWSFSYVESVRNIMSGALEKLEAMKESDPETYNTYYYRTAGAYLENMFLQIELYMSKYTKEHIDETIDLFEETANYYGMYHMAEGGPLVSVYLSKWRDANV